MPLSDWVFNDDQNAWEYVTPYIGGEFPPALPTADVPASGSPFYTLTFQVDNSTAPVTDADRTTRHSYYSYKDFNGDTGTGNFNYSGGQPSPPYLHVLAFTGTGDATDVMTVEPQALYPSTYGAAGYSDGGATPPVDYPPAIPEASSPDGSVLAPRPATIDPPTIYRTSETMGPLTLNGRGRPVDWQVAHSVREPWGELRVFCGTTDVTYLRGIPTQIKSWSLVEPFGYGPAEIALPQVSPYDTLGAGDLSFFVQGMNVTIKRVRPDGTLVQLWEGFAASWEPDMSDDGYSFALHCSGALFQANLEPHPPSWRRDRIDLGLAIKEAFDNVPGRRYAAFPAVTTNVGTRNRGSWSTVTDYAQELLSTAYNSDGTKQWTVGCNPGRFPTLHIKDTTTAHWHTSVGQRGMTLRESSDITATVNVIYGEGTADDGCRWRNSRYPTSFDRPAFVPLVGVSQNMPYVWDDDAGQWQSNPSYDPNRLRVAKYENFGSGISLADGTESARAELTRDVNPGWSGTLEMAADPEEGCRLDIKAGQNIVLRHHHGGNRLFHISQVDVSIEDVGYKVSLTIDTNARDNVTLAGIRARDKEAATDPARRLNPPRRKSRGTQDEHPVFDCESGAGKVTGWAVAGGTWNVRRVPFAAWGSIVGTKFTCSSATTFAAAVFGQAVTAGQVAALVPAPLTTEDPWDAPADALSDLGLQVAWGSKTQKGGYYPGQQDKPPATITGRMVDDQSWDYISATPPWVWLCFYPAAGTTVAVQFDNAPDA